MSVQSHLSSLHQKHESLEEKINDAFTHHVSDTEVAQLKKEKLRLKDEIEFYNTQLETKQSA